MGYVAAIDPPREVVDAVAPVSGKILKLLPHAYVIKDPRQRRGPGASGLDTVQLNGAGFTALAAQGDTATAGQPVIIYDVPAIVAAGMSPIVLVVVMDERDPSNVAVSDAVAAAADITTGATLHGEQEVLMEVVILKDSAEIGWWRPTRSSRC